MSGATSWSFTRRCWASSSSSSSSFRPAALWSSSAGSPPWRAAGVSAPTSCSPTSARAGSSEGRKALGRKGVRRRQMQAGAAIGAIFGARGKGRTAAEASGRAEEVLTRVGLQHRIDHTAADLTIPDLKRLELAKALAMDPELLLLDEVMAGLTPTEIESAMDV